MGTGDVVEPVAPRDGVAAAVVALQLGEDLVSDELMPPSPEEYQDTEPLVPDNVLKWNLLYLERGFSFALKRGVKFCSVTEGFKPKMGLISKQHFNPPSVNVIKLFFFIPDHEAK